VSWRWPSFGWFANVFPVGIDAGIVVLLALDLLLTWLRIPFPLTAVAADEAVGAAQLRRSDPHRATASRVPGLPEDEVRP
jgi:hypothetical protein